MKTIPKYFYAVPFAIMAAGFIIGQGKEGAGVPVVILLSTMFTVYMHKHWSGEKANG